MILIAQYQGKSLISKIIKAFTRSKWSHSAALLDDCSVIEAWHVGGVSHVESLFTNHAPGTPIDLFSVACTSEQKEEFKNFLTRQIGKKYDFRMVFRFLTRKKASKNNRWFCSELVTAALNHAGIYPLSDVDPAEVSPHMLAISPLLKPVSRIMHGAYGVTRHGAD